MKKDLITIQEPVITEAKDEATLLISQAIDKGVTVETMEKLLAMRKDLKQEKSKEEFDKAMAGFQSECPTIQKKTQGYNYKYADLTTIVEQIKGILAKYGFSYTFDTDDVENTIVVSCKVKHISGHMEVSKATITRETTTKMNASQQSGAAMTYGKRYAFVNAFGLLTGDEDNDAATPHYNAPMKPYVKSPTVAPEQTEVSIDDAYTSYARETTENGVQAIVEDKYGQMSIGALKVEVSQQMNSGKIKKDYAALSKATKEELIETLKNA